MRVIAGKARSLPLKTLPTKDVRPTTDKTKETLFNILMPLLPGCSFLDLFAGSGGIGIEALSRGAKKAVFVEQDAKACAVIKDNLHFTKLDRDAELIRGDVLRALPSLAAKGPFDIIFMDPPFDHELEKEVLMRLADFPLLKEDGTIVTNIQQIDPMPVVIGAAEYPADLEKKLKEAGARVDAMDCVALAGQAGPVRAVNLVLLGRLSHYFDFPDEAWQKAIEACVPPKFLEVNKKAFELGRSAQ